MLFLPQDKGNVKFRMEKIDTYLLLSHIGCPVARSAIIFPEEKVDLSVCKNLSDYFQSSQAIVRYLYLHPNFAPISGGRLYDISVETLNCIRVEGTLLWLLEPSDKLCNDYGIDLLFADNVCTIEIVGKGFDVTDLNRGQLHPHETITSELPVRFGIYEEWWKFLHFTFVDQQSYEESICLRLNKLSRLGITASREIFNNSFVPLPYEKLEELLNYISILYSSVSKTEYCVSCCIYKNHFVFWDIQTPLGKKIAYGVK